MVRRLNSGLQPIKVPLLLIIQLGWKKGITLKIEKNADGSITVRKA